MTKTNKISIRLTDKEMEMIESIREKMQKEMMGLTLSNSDIIRMALTAFSEGE